MVFGGFGLPGRLRNPSETNVFSFKTQHRARTDLQNLPVRMRTEAVERVFCTFIDPTKANLQLRSPKSALRHLSKLVTKIARLGWTEHACRCRIKCKASLQHLRLALLAVQSFSAYPFSSLLFCTGLH